MFARGRGKSKNCRNNRNARRGLERAARSCEQILTRGESSGGYPGWERAAGKFRTPGKRAEEKDRGEEAGATRTRERRSALSDEEEGEFQGKRRDREKYIEREAPCEEEEERDPDDTKAKRANDECRSGRRGRGTRTDMQRKRETLRR